MQIYSCRTRSYTYIQSLNLFSRSLPIGREPLTIVLFTVSGDDAVGNARPAFKCSWGGHAVGVQGVDVTPGG